MAKVSIRKTGTATHPWEAWCHSCREETTHFTQYGVVTCNTPGIGNRVWALAMLAGYAHLKEKHG